MSDVELVEPANTDLVKAADVPDILARIRPAWQAKDLVVRVRRLLPVDPSSACQRLFNAAIHDLREKVIIAGVAIAREAARLHKLPPVERPEDIEDYSTARLIELCYRMGVLTRPEWRRMSRVHEIRRDLEHEDDEYEAGLEDIVYVFSTCVEAVLSKDPVQLLRVKDVKDIIEQPGPAVPDQSLLDDYERAPQPRQDEIGVFLISTVLDDANPEVVRQNALATLRSLQPLTHNAVKLKLASHMQERVGRGKLSVLQARTANASGALPYLKPAQREQLFETLYDEMKKIGHRWTAHAHHGDLLRMVQEVGGLRSAPPRIRRKILQWLVLTHMGEPGYGRSGRPIFYSNSAAPLVEELVAEAADVLLPDLRALKSASAVREAARDERVARRFEILLDIAETRAVGPAGESA